MNAKNIIVPVSAIVITLSVAFAGTRAQSTEEVKEKLAALADRHSTAGGMAVKPGSGCFAFVSAQSVYSDDELSGLTRSFRDQLQFPIAFRQNKDAVRIGNVRELMSSMKIDVAIFFVEDGSLPMSIVSMEERWALVNVSKIADASTTGKMKLSRLDRECSRVVKALFSGSTKEKDKKAVTKADDLDAITSDPIDGQTLFNIMNGLPSYGLVKSRTVPYKKACREGWAPAPTNDVQRKIWNQVHELPTKPLPLVKPTK